MEDRYYKYATYGLDGQTGAAYPPCRHAFSARLRHSLHNFFALIYTIIYSATHYVK
jgi:hypothetical protein